jgi:hypothetical protein
MAKKKATKKAATRKPACTARVWWPGPTRFYDADVDCGAVLLTGEQARALVRVVEEHYDLFDQSNESGRLWSALQTIRATFRIDDAFPLVRYRTAENE